MASFVDFERFSKSWLVAFAVITVVYWIWFGLLVGFQTSDLNLYLLILFLFFFNKSSRQIFVLFSPFFIYLIFYSSLRALGRINPLNIHIEDLYKLEVQLFGINHEGTRISVNEYFMEHAHALLDLFAGSFYITWVPFPIFFAFIVFFSKKPKIAFDFWIAFFIANIFGFLGYIIYPAAPPWYYFEYGNELINTVPCNAAGLARFDDMLGINMYRAMYSQGTNTFGAIPSMHAAFPLLLVYYSLKFKNHWLTALFTLSLIGIWFGAVYSAHHYVIDMILGIVCGILGLIITELLVNRKFVPYWYKSALNFIR
ncbi:MAG: phosphatase PAP2 family protein [Saprospiraceae bacterium]|jgi:hypothetical protein